MNEKKYLENEKAEIKKEEIFLHDDEMKFVHVKTSVQVSCSKYII